VIIVNFKNYKEGKEVLKLVKQIGKYNKKIICAVPAVNISEVSNKGIKIYAQAVWPFEKGRGTGYVTPSAIKKAGAKGTLINHSENLLGFEEIEECVRLCKKNKLESVVCVSSIAETKKVMRFKPTAIAFEIPELISTGKAITDYYPKKIKEFVKALKGTKIIPVCGAGISSRKDVIRAYELGCKGVLPASAIANTKNPEKILKTLRDL